MPEPLRIGLHIPGFVLTVVGLSRRVALLWPGPVRVAEAIGMSCANDRDGTNGKDPRTIGLRRRRRQ
ncbi:hypothetical protein [Mycobacterium sp. DL592]|uniref:hypothetical protein n=1 Tax=Mycobacterium sp. DL592 TaxID=2675524 RepID=UPI00141E4576|nr:hypothetical protein [Mycobacterium sp. DL592]